MKRFPSPPFVLLENTRSRDKNRAGILFQDPLKIIECKRLQAVSKTLEKIETHQKQGNYLAGWVGYEAGFAFHPTLNSSKVKLSPEPLVWMGVFEKPEFLCPRELDRFFQKVKGNSPDAGLKREPVPGEDEKAFRKAFEKIQSYIRAGDVYQVNHTFRLGLETFGRSLAYYSKLREAQPVPFSAFIETGSWEVFSLSPELFICRRGETLISRPMKGTAKPGRSLEETEEKMKALSEDEKNRAENLMITDLIRNDFSRVCLPGSVSVPKLFKVERFPTVLQMSSEVHGQLKPGMEFRDIFKALFPCGSVTGAPKIRAMEVIRETEAGPRGLYTGALGFLAPEGDFTFNVPIRTVVIDSSGKGWLGIGSGLVAQSKAGEEFDECHLKGKFLSADQKDFALIETLLWEPEKGFHFLEAHLERLKASAEYFDFPLCLKAIREGLDQAIEKRERGPALKIRLTGGKNGVFSISTQPVISDLGKSPLKVVLSAKRVSSENVFLYHKTTRRALYDRELAKAKKAGFLDVIFRNEKGQITEGVIHNIFVKENRGTLVTPPLKAGLLPGVLRADLLKNGDFKESSLTCDDLKKAQKIWLGNSVSGLVEVTVENLSG